MRKQPKRTFNHNSDLLFFAYTDFYESVCAKIGIDRKGVLDRLHPAYREKDKTGKLNGDTRATRFSRWGLYHFADYTNHDERIRLLELYIRTILPRLHREAVADDNVREMPRRTKKDMKQMEFNLEFS